MRLTPEIVTLDMVSGHLEDIVDKLVFLGGSVVPLLQTDPASPPVRPTKDIDFAVQCFSRAEYYEIETELAHRGFHLRSDEPVVCRFFGHGFVIDVMPVDTVVLGFGNRWFKYAHETSWIYSLPSGREIFVIDPVLFLATKFEAFNDRGNRDIYASHDLEDIVATLNGRQEIVEEIDSAKSEVRMYVKAEMSALAHDVRFKEALEGHIGSLDEAPRRVDVLINRWMQICELK